MYVRAQKGSFRSRQEALRRARGMELAAAVEEVWCAHERAVLNRCGVGAEPAAPFGAAIKEQLYPHLGSASMAGGLLPTAVFMNNGGTGSVMEPVIQLREVAGRMGEEQPMRWHRDFVPPLLARCRREAGGYLGCAPDALTLLPSVSTGFYLVLEALQVQPGDLLLTTSLCYHSFTDDLAHFTTATGTEVRVAEVPYPLEHTSQIVGAMAALLDGLRAAGELGKVKLAFFDHIASKPAILCPVHEIGRASTQLPTASCAGPFAVALSLNALVRFLHTAALCRTAGVPTLVDGAHGPGQLAWTEEVAGGGPGLRLDQLGADLYIANFHKCAAASHRLPSCPAAG